ncbi:DUF3231 family protein [Halalkalibacter akibai]|uniref:DUF3231 family protein n=1 Tax=Halalkalibacter akibai (strain ATCC 43226 / DSM 21942 / CIP 109018 / JCM 9157 / 1139) TaxID=1236973 RepID=W4QZF8_HALA3|nr:DUF3231 family protein [Halalkalibacter akibai]GAE36699.1 hypothetical protein JCM9157_3912 [Halalkalibacter akibai JCM 9157]
MPENPAITSSELGTLWLTYQEKTMILRMLDYFIEKADDDKAENIMNDLYGEIDQCVNKIAAILKREGAAVPIAFTEHDVHKEVPKLYDNGFDIMFVRLLKEISMALHSLNMTMSYREDIVLLYDELTDITQKYYHLCTQYLLEKGMIARPPYVNMPKAVGFVKDTNYLSGLQINPFTKRRTLNSIEVAHLYHIIDSNVLGMNMITGFAQCATKEEVRKYFIEGATLAKSIIKELSEILLDDNIHTPMSPGGNPTLSTVAPFSDKLMMYCTSLFCSFALGGNSLGTAFSMRNDLPVKMAAFMKDTLQYAHKGAKIMINNGWMEEPPQMEERNQL